MAVFTYPAIDPVLFQVGPFAVHWYGLAYIVGFAAAGWLFAWLNRRWDVGLTADDILSVVLYCVLGVLIGGRLGYVLFYGGETFRSDPLQVVRIWNGGMSWHGGFVGIVVAGLLVSRRFKVPFLRLADMAAVGAPIGFGLGRLANFINNELWGRTTDVAWGVVFPGAGTIPRHPSQIYEALLEGVALFLVMVWLARRKRPDGFMFGVFMSGYGAFRFFVEFFREPDAQLGFLWGGATMGQLLSIPLMIAGSWFIFSAIRATPRSSDAPVPQAQERLESHD